MQAPEKRNPGWRAGASGTLAGERQFHVQSATPADRLQYRLSSFALALDAVLPDVAFLETAVQMTAQGFPLPAGGQVRLHRLALKLFDLRVVLEEPMPEVRR